MDREAVAKSLRDAAEAVHLLVNPPTVPVTPKNGHTPARKAKPKTAVQRQSLAKARADRRKQAGLTKARIRRNAIAKPVKRAKKQQTLIRTVIKSVPTPVVGPPGPIGKSGDRGAQGSPGRNGQDGVDGRDGAADAAALEPILARLDALEKPKPVETIGIRGYGGGTTITRREFDDLVALVMELSGR